MTQIQIGSYTSAYNDADNFDFPNNPYSVVPSNASRKSLIDLPYKSVCPFLDFGTVTPINLTITGTLMGTSRDTNMRLLAKKVYSKNLKKFWISSTKFIYVFGGTLRTSLLGKRNMFNDYVISFISNIPFFYSGTGKSYTSGTISNGSATTLNNASKGAGDDFDNIGSAPAHIQHIEVAHASGTITKIEIGDSAISGSDVAGDNILEWSGSLTTGTLHLYLLYHIGHACKKWYYFLNASDSAPFGTLDMAGADLEDGPRVSASADDQSFSVKLTGGTATFKFYWNEADYVK